MGLLSIFSFVKEIFKPAADLVDNLHTSKEEKMILRNELARMEYSMQEKMLEFNSKLMEAQTSIINTEAKGESWLQRSWRPITMLTFLVMIICNSFGLFQVELNEHVWTLLQFGLGGYVAGRSIEKTVPKLYEIFKAKKDDDR
jgi:hypothetical protein